MLTDAQAVARLRKVLGAIPQEHGGGVKAWAEQNGLNYSHVRDVRDGRRPMSDSVAQAIGLKRVHGWESR